MSDLRPPRSCPSEGTAIMSSSLSPTDIVRQLMQRTAAGDATAIDELIAEDMINHAAEPRGRAGWRYIVDVKHDLADLTAEHHAFVGEGDLVAHHMTLRGTHRASMMPLWDGAPVTGKTVCWPFMHFWRIDESQVVEHWACRDDIGLLTELGLWKPRTGP